MDMEHHLPAEDTPEQADPDNAPADATPTGFLGFLGEIVAALGELAVDGVDAVTTRRRLRAMSSVLEKNGGSGRLSDAELDYLFQVRRRGLYSVNVQESATDLIIRAAGASPADFDRVLQSLLRLPLRDIKDLILYQLPEACPIIWLKVHAHLAAQAMNTLLDSKLKATDDVLGLDDFTSFVNGIVVLLPAPDKDISEEIYSPLFKWTRRAGNLDRTYGIVLTLADSGWARTKEEMAEQRIWEPKWTDELQYVISSLVSSQVDDDWSGGIVGRIFSSVFNILFWFHEHANSCDRLPESFWSIALEMVQIVDGSKLNYNLRAIEAVHTRLDTWDHLRLACYGWRLALDGRARMSPVLAQWTLNSLQRADANAVKWYRCCIRNVLRADPEPGDMALGDREMRRQLGEVRAAFQRKLDEC